MSLAAGDRRTFPLVPRRRLIGLPFGEAPSRRRGQGSEIVGYHRYEPGDPVATIDWFASARLTATSGEDAFVVRHHAADEAPRVALVVDRRPEMGLYPAPLPWLHKPAAMLEAVTVIAASAEAARADIAGLDVGGGEEWWLPPARRDRGRMLAERVGADAPFAAPSDVIAQSFEFLLAHRRVLPPGTFVFVLSDFLAPPPNQAWLHGLSCGWDLVPVVIQDPVWEQSFPVVGGIGLPIADPRSGEIRLVRLSSRQAASRAEANKRRLARLLADFESFGLQAVVLGTSDADAIDMAFNEWAEQRRSTAWAR
jgi:uncharacterized protein (DUF58 family)